MVSDHAASLGNRPSHPPPNLAGVSDPVRETRATYDRIATAYAERSGAPYPRLDPHVEWFAGALPARGRAADVGCGPGRDTRLLRAAGLRVAGFDLSAAQLRAGGLEGVAQADMRALPLADSTVDGVWCQAALLHLPRELAPAAARRVRPRHPHRRGTPAHRRRG